MGGPCMVTQAVDLCESGLALPGSEGNFWPHPGKIIFRNPLPLCDQDPFDVIYCFFLVF